jgi:GNAT superfamily N-acetyltransferase
MMAISIRDAVVDDAVAAADVRVRSITELCTPDHHDDPAILAKWLSNKSPEIFKSWIAQPDNSVLVAVKDNTIVDVGSVTDRGDITLNYVLPAARFRGVSRALLAALERRAREKGNTRCTLRSTETARRFYRSAGYIEEGPAVAGLGTPMSKHLIND